MSAAEQSYTATGSKLAYHWPIFQKYRETGYGSIIRATCTFHQSCSSHCSYCSTINRLNADTTTLEENKAFVRTLYHDQAAFNRDRFPGHNALYKTVTGSDIRLRGLILSGGGQPNLYPGFAEFVAWVREECPDLDLGLITNGFPKRVPEDVYRAFKWIRISITPEHESPHYVGGKFDRQYIPETILRRDPGQTVGLSYVYGEEWSTDELMVRIGRTIDHLGFDYCRMLVDCNKPLVGQIDAHALLDARLKRLGLDKSKIFRQGGKLHGTPDAIDEVFSDGQCGLQVYSTFWDTSGHHKNGYSWCYPCDSVTVLADTTTDSERRFVAEKWGTVKNTEVSRLFTEPVRPFFDPRKNCQACLFVPNNRQVKQLSASAPLRHYDGPTPEHINFP